MKTTTSSPKFKIGQKISGKTRKTGLFTGIVEEVERCFRSETGSVTEERHIKLIPLPYTFDGETLTIQFPETVHGSFIQKAYTSVSKFSGYSYAVRTADRLIGVDEKQIKAVAAPSAKLTKSKYQFTKEFIAGIEILTELPK